MGISFKVSKIGKRFRPKPGFVSDETEQLTESSKESSQLLGGAGSKPEVDVTEAANGNNNLLQEHEVSFTLNLYQMGYYIGKPSEIENCRTVLQDVKSLHPYDRASETLLSAIEAGWLPGDLLDDIPSKYVDGTVICEIRDYRDFAAEQGTAISASNIIPVVHKVRLRMSSENVVKDMPLIADDSWSYSDLMEVEARILKALKPRLCLDPTPMLERLCKDPIVTKLNICIGRKRRSRPISDLTVESNNQNPEKKICPENSNPGVGEIGTQISNASLQQVYESVPIQQPSNAIPSIRPNNFGQDTVRPTLPLPSQPKLQTAVNSPTVAQERSSELSPSFSGVHANMSSSQTLMGSYADTLNNSSISVRRDNTNSQLTPMVGIRRQKQTPIGVDSVQQQQHQTGSQMVGLTGTDMQWRNQLLHSVDTKGVQYTSTLGGQRYSSNVISSMTNQETGTSFYFNHQGVNYASKEEQIDRQELERSKEALQALTSVNRALDQQQSRAQHLLQLPYMRNHAQTPQWQNAGSLSEKDMGKDDAHHRRKSVPSPRVSSGPMVQSPVSSRSGEISSGSAGGQFSGIATASALGVQKDKLTSNPNAAVGAPSVTSSPSDSLHRQQQTSGTAKQKQTSMTKTQGVSTVGSPASVSNMNPPLTANSPSIGNAPICDQAILERFVKIDAVVQRYQLSVKKSKIDDYRAKEPIKHSAQQLAVRLSESFTAEDYTDQVRPMSRSLIGGTINSCKARTMSFVRTERMYQVCTRLIMTERPFDGTVSMQYGYMDDSDVQDYQQTLPTTLHADLLAAQFSQLMEHDGYPKTEDQIRPIPIRMVAPPGSLPSASAITSDTAASEMKSPELGTGPSSQVASPAITSGVEPMNSSQNPSSNARMLTAANNNRAMAASQGYIPGTAMPTRIQQIDQSMLQAQQQQMPSQQQLQQTAHSQLPSQQQLPFSQMPRSNTLLSNNPLSQIIGQNTNLPLGPNQMVNNKPTPLQLQMLQQQPQLPRKMMGLNPAMSMGNIGSNMLGLGNLSNVIGMGGIRGMSSALGPISGLGNLSPHQMNLVPPSNFNASLPPNSLTHAQATAAAATKLRLAQQNRAGLFGQSGIAGMQASTNQMLPSSAGLSMFGTPNRGTMNSLQRNAMSSMGPPKVPGANFYLNPQQQLKQQQLQPQQSQQLQPQQQHQQLQVQQQQQLQQQQLQQQQLQPQQLQSQQLQPQQQQQQLQVQQQQQQMQQQISSPLQQQQVGSPVVGSPTMVMQHSQISQQMSQQTAMSPQQLSSGALQQMNNSGNLGAGPASPQLSSQTHGSVGSISSSPMEQLQGASKAGSASNV